MIEDLDNMSIDELATIESNKLNNLFKDGPDSIRKSVGMWYQLTNQWRNSCNWVKMTNKLRG
jgi:hypothetical protein